VIERHRNADAVSFGQAHGAADEIAVVEDIVVRQRDALGRSGRFGIGSGNLVLARRSVNGKAGTG
jgi:hypothetical protein